MNAGPRVCRAWVRCYTRTLPAEVASRRGEEIESDLFEHARDARAGGLGETSFTIEVIGRVLSGIPADLSWRRAIRKEPQTRFALGGSTMEAKPSRIDLAYLLVLVVDLAIVIVAFPVYGSFGEITMLLTWTLPTVGILVAALVTRYSRPVLSLACAVLGSISAALHYYWLPPVYLLPIATIILGIIATRRPRPVAAEVEVEAA